MITFSYFSQMRIYSSRKHIRYFKQSISKSTCMMNTNKFLCKKQKICHGQKIYYIQYNDNDVIQLFYSQKKKTKT